MNFIPCGRWVLVSLFTLIFFPRSVLFATAQYPEVLLLDGKEEMMMATPLEDYFSELHPRPKEFVPTTSACWRGYVGRWELRDQQLFLTKLERRLYKQGPHQVSETIPLTLVFPKASGPVFAEWFSGILRISRGEVLQYVHMGYGSVYEEDVFLNIVKGQVVGRKTVDNRNRPQSSNADLAWRELGRMSDAGGLRSQTPDTSVAEEAGEWKDGTDLANEMDALLKAKQPISVRGIFFAKRLWLPGGNFDLALDHAAVSKLPDDGAPAEVTGVLGLDADGAILLRLQSARALPPGLAIERTRARGPAGAKEK